MTELTATQEALVRRIAMTSVGLLVQTGIDEDFSGFVAAGSGVVCKLPKGTVVILTAGHVAEHLLAQELGGVYGVPSANPNARPLQFLTKHTDHISFSGGAGTSHGPDIAVLKLPPNINAWLESGRICYDIKTRMENRIREDENFQDTVIVGLPSTAYSRFVSQIGDTRRDEHVLMVAPGAISNGQTDDEGFDRFEYFCEHGDTGPETYQGVSGGGVWTFNGDDGTVLPRLAGIAYYQSDATESGERVIHCAGPKSVYAKVLQAAAERWEP
ncbi:hypothetical protein RMS29_028230 (plasmid) [Agrobacterium rosae]|uniref:Uncharacterized protein n=1 Tax=Agrobacterium rosae TaxID=1972867 RepID=A0ABU4W517_9HYPH|nr:hypothetical protein [Agrobacterium rosae]MDX8332875.1 hypothetical protein [Agrobacterium rosae]